MADAISYKRFSSSKQGRRDSDRRQTALTEDYCRHHRLRLIDAYLDAGMSGFTGANLSDGSALRALLHAAQAGRFKRGTRLIVESLDRLSRREISLALRLFLDILDTGLVIVTLIDGEQVFTRERVDRDITALIIAIVFLARAHNESQTKRERALRAQRLARAKAREHKIPMTAECPRWLTLVGRGDERHFVVDPGRARIVQHIFKLSAGGMGQLHLARHLNDHRVPTFGGLSRWRPGMVGHLLKSRAVLGTFHPHLGIIQNGKRRKVLDPDGPIEGYFPAIIEPELFSAVQRATTKRRRHNGNRVVPAYNNLMTRLGRCALCNDSLYLSQTKDGFAYLRCVNVRERVCANNLGFPYRKLEAVLLSLDVITELLSRLDNLRAAGRSTTGSAAELEKGREPSSAGEAIAIALVERRGFQVRFKEAKARLQSPDIEERHRARATIVGELQALFEGMVLHPGRLLSLHAKPDLVGRKTVFAVGSEGTLRLQVTGIDGTTGFVGEDVLAEIVPRVTSGCRRRTEPALEATRPYDLDCLMHRITIIELTGEDWQASMLRALTLAHVVRAAETTLAGARPSRHVTIDVQT